MIFLSYQTIRIEYLFLIYILLTPILFLNDVLLLETVEGSSLYAFLMASFYLSQRHEALVIEKHFSKTPNQGGYYERFKTINHIGRISHSR